MNRHELRVLTYKAVFGAEFGSADELNGRVDVMLKTLDDESSDIGDIVDEADAELVRSRAASVFEHLEKIDAIITDKSEGWSIERMGKSELAIIRLATYEMFFDDVPKGVAINEAVELAKQYCDENAYVFVNGVLSKLAKEDA